MPPTHEGKTMTSKNRLCRCALATAGIVTTLCGLAILLSDCQLALGGQFSCFWRNPRCLCAEYAGCGEEPPNLEVGGAWYWLRSPEEEKRVVIGLFNRYCIRCHGVDGRGVWDIPDVPNFTNPRWQATRTDGQLARAILEGRGSVMPPWRGAISLEEAWAIARYVRTLGSGTEASRPDLSKPETSTGSPQRSGK
jgi:hypothetical protein